MVVSFFFLRDWSISSKFSNMCVELFVIISMILLISAGSIVIFLILVICVFFLFLSVLLEVSQFYSVFQRTISLFQ